MPASKPNRPRFTTGITPRLRRELCYCGSFYMGVVSGGALFLGLQMLWTLASGKPVQAVEWRHVAVLFVGSFGLTIWVLHNLLQSGHGPLEVLGSQSGGIARVATCGWCTGLSIVVLLVGGVAVVLKFGGLLSAHAWLFGLVGVLGAILVCFVVPAVLLELFLRPRKR